MKLSTVLICIGITILLMYLLKPQQTAELLPAPNLPEPQPTFESIPSGCPPDDDEDDIIC